MEWNIYKGGDLKQGTICKTSNNDFIFVGEINTSLGTNDEFREDITHYTEEFCKDIESKIKFAKLNYER